MGGGAGVVLLVGRKQLMAQSSGEFEGAGTAGNAGVLVIATHNVKKAGEMVTILRERIPELTIRTLADYPGAPEPEEIGETYAENATIKAVSAARFTGELCVADDAGLEIDALDGAPGLRSKRFGGEDLPFPEKMAMILDSMKDVPEEGRGARFRCCVAVADGRAAGLSKPEAVRGGTESAQGSGRRVVATNVFEATCEGRIALERSGSGGFGYDPIFYLPELGCCMADLSAAEKHAISHRGKVLKLFGDWMAGRRNLPR